MVLIEEQAVEDKVRAENVLGAQQCKHLALNFDIVYISGHCVLKRRAIGSIKSFVLNVTLHNGQQDIIAVGHCSPVAHICRS